ncbi:hypothetical protein ACN47E_004717 [Coniothyrium glycines]
MSSQVESMDIAMLDTNSTIPLFDAVIQRIHNTVLTEHLSEIQHNGSSSVLLNALRTASTGSHGANAAFSRDSQKFALFVRTFMPYFEVLSICTTVNSEWTQWFWGTLHLLFEGSCRNPLLLEKIASMFEAIAHVLPRYQQIYDTCRHNVSVTQLSNEDHRLATLISWAYADIVELILDLYLICGPRIEGNRSRCSMFESVGEATWRPLDARFARLEARLVHHRKWLEKETSNYVQHYAEIEQYRNFYFEFLLRQSEPASNKRTIAEHERSGKRLRRVNKIQTWLSSYSTLTAIYDYDTSPFSGGSWVWFYDIPMYRRWKDGLFVSSIANDKSTLASTWQHRILFVQASEGFGKTCLAHAVHDSLDAAAEDPEGYASPPATASFHFSSKEPNHDRAEDAFRAIVYRLLHVHRHSRSTLDLVCLLSRRTSLHSHATIDEVLDTLSILLRQHPTFLIIDGLNDCDDSHTFLEWLARLCRTSDVKVILFSRSNIRIPLEYQKWASDAPHILVLDKQHNSTAIEAFLAQKLGCMADQGFFGISVDRDLLTSVTRVADGSFLWSNMILKFLESPLLTSDERRVVLENVSSLAGLGNMYHNMLGALERRQKHEKRDIANAFRWLSFSINTLSPQAFQAILFTSESAPPSDHGAEDRNQALVTLSCGLLTSSHGRLSFAHPSIHHYLRSVASQGSEFSLHDESAIHAHLATQCLSYLAHIMAKQPLCNLEPPSPSLLPAPTADSSASMRTSKSGDSGYKSMSSSDGDTNNAPTTIDGQSQAENTNLGDSPPPTFDSPFPFLRYASLCWPVHLSRALSPNHPPSTTPTYPFITALHAFLTSRRAVTAWVEASFRYNLPPTLARLVGPLADLRGEIPPSTPLGKELRAVVNEMRELSEQLVEVKREYEARLRRNPSLIWQMDRLRGASEEFWVVWEDMIS